MTGDEEIPQPHVRAGGENSDTTLTVGQARSPQFPADPVAVLRARIEDTATPRVILNAAARLVIRSPRDPLSLPGLAAQARMSQTLIRYHYPTESTLLDELAGSGFTRLARACAHRILAPTPPFEASIAASNHVVVDIMSDPVIRAAVVLERGRGRGTANSIRDELLFPFLQAHTDRASNWADLQPNVDPARLASDIARTISTAVSVPGADEFTVGEYLRSFWEEALPSIASASSQTYYCEYVRRTFQCAHTVRR